MKVDATSITLDDIQGDYDFKVIDPSFVTIGYEQNYTSILREAFEVESVYGRSIVFKRYGEKDMSGLKNLLESVK